MWSPCVASASDAGVVQLGRFGHSATLLLSADSGSDSDSSSGSGDAACPLVVAYGGVAAAPARTSTSGAGADGQPQPQPPQQQPQQAQQQQQQQQQQQPPQRALGDVVVFNAAAGAWFPPCAAPPPPPDGAAAGPGPRAFHSAAALGGGALAVFGGHILTLEAGSGRRRRVFFDDLWLLESDGWSWRRVELAPSSPAPPKRDMACLASLGAGRLLLFGGRSEQQRALGDAWLFDAGTASWTQLQPEGPAPPPRKMAALAPLPPPRPGAPSGAAVLFGGERDSGLLDDAWLLQLQPQPAAAEGASPPAAAAAAAVAARWVQLRLKGGGPSSRFGHALVAVASPPDSAAGAAPPASAGDAPASGRVFVFGGCVDSSAFPFLSRSYAQTAELWCADLAANTWVHIQPEGSPPPADGDSAAAAAPPPWPCERMCHTLTPLPDGRVLLLGGRCREGIRDDAWWFVPPKNLPSLATAAAPGAAAAQTGASSGGGMAERVGRPGSQASLFQALLQPLRPRDAPAATPPPAPPPAAAISPLSGSTASSPRRLSSQPQFDSSPSLVRLESAGGGPSGSGGGSGGTAAAAAAAARQPAFPQPQALAQLHAAGAGLLQAAGSRDWSDLRSVIRNPAAALSSLSSLTTRLGSQLQPGLEALSSRLGPAALLDYANNTNLGARLAAIGGAQPGGAAAPLAPLRAQMGLLPAPGAGLAAGGGADWEWGGAAGGPGGGGGGHIEALARLGRQLLGSSSDDGAAGGGEDEEGQLAAEVLVSAARQRLMAVEPGELPLGQLRLLAADYAALAGYGLEQRLLSRAGQGASGGGGGGEPGWPTDGLLCSVQAGRLRLADVAALQRSYEHLLSSEEA
ncbi:hypothetical protein Rsub_08564 [Raphidocelis subcapitata]|uniref:Uncharacterized protein n=1 Tax=Raphidocelis subcapitata TaxID=307507 RepID=A0A2V0PCF4_9CHLO|nr:hypothetical protein Rsub_08564 [Raphidocelis subcapitata]|eukprot:GBF95583.1 hypothetical protein Rsub_08564 [Raphidocelis subcapitata]